MDFIVTILCRCKIRVPLKADQNATMAQLSETAIDEITSSNYPSEDLTYTVTKEDILGIEEISFRPKK